MFYTLLITYILGGLTFIPLVILGGLAFAYYTTDPIDSPDSPALKPNVSDVKVVEEKPSASTTTTSNLASTTLRPPTLKAWLTVRRTFEPSPSSYISLVRTLLDARSSHPRRAEDAYYAVLKGAVLYLYEDEVMSECAAAIDVARCYVRVFPVEGLLDGELFAKRNALLIHETGGEGMGLTSTVLEPDSSQSHAHLPTPAAPWFIFFRSVTLMEDWYFALLAVPRISSAPTSSLSTTPNASAPYPYAAHHALISSLDALPDLIPTRWLNAVLGRLFLGVKGTRAVEAWVIGRLMKKLAKVKTPSFLSAVVVRSFDAGDVAPVLSKPMLKELTPEGEASVGVDVSYIAPPGGEMRITISATATISLPGTASLSLLGFSTGRGKDKEREHEDEREKQGEEGKAKGKDRAEGKEKDTQRPYEVSLVLAIVVHRVEGNVLFKIKRPPSNRLWYAFTTAPHMEVTVEPVVSDRRVRWGMVLAAIEGKLKEIIQESVVLPYMDDIPFFDTTPYALRGGIFADAFTEAARAGEEAATTATTSTASTSTNTLPTTPATDRDFHTSHDIIQPTNSLTDTSMKQVHRARSADAIGASEQDLGATEEQSMVRAETIGSTSGVRKRRTWFGKRESSGEDDNGDGQRSHERVRSAENIRVSVTRDEETQDETQQFLRADSARAITASEDTPSSETGAVTGARLSSSAPSPSPLSVSPPTPQSALPSPYHSLTPAFSRQTSSASAPASPPPATPSFLSTLKIRSAGMAEKQPVLKEAMRKWGAGVNWAAGLRKDASGGRERDREKDRTKEIDRERERAREMEMEMEADQGEFWGGAREGSWAEGGVSESYADLRRKVEGREMERLRTVSKRSSGSGTRPINIPGAERGGDAPAPSTSSRAPSVRSDTSSSCSIVKVSPQAVGGSGFLAPSAPRTTTELHTAVRTPSPTPIHAESLPPSPRQRTGSTQSSIITSPLFDKPSTPTLATPIRAQPKAATMTIPGIHARHRGEVMALGSEPMKAEEVGEVKGGAGDGEGGVGAGKTIQSVYRLLRGGNAQVPMQVEGDAEERTGAVEPRNLSPSAAAVPNLNPNAIPPPLPPRSFIQPMPVQSPSGDAYSPASQALKSVAQQDAARQPPPLPMRRASEQILTPGDMTTISSSPASLSTSTSVSNTPASTSTSDQDPPCLDPSVRTSQTTLSDENAKWKPPLPPRRSTSSVNNIQA